MSCMQQVCKTIYTTFQHLALTCFYPACVCVAFGADVFCCCSLSPFSQEGRTPLHLACGSGSYHIVRILLHKADFPNVNTKAKVCPAPRLPIVQYLFVTSRHAQCSQLIVLLLCEFHVCLYICHALLCMRVLTSLPRSPQSRRSRMRRVLPSVAGLG